MEYSKTLIKQVDIYLHGHIYEHIIATEIDRFLMNQKTLPIIDYRLIARVEDGIDILQIESYDNNILDKIERHIKEYTFDKTIIQNTVEQISAEYSRYYNLDLENLTNKLQAIHKEPWLNRQNNLYFTKPITDQAREFNSNEIRFLRRSPRSFNEISHVYKLEKCPYELKPLAVYTIQVLAMAHINLLYQKLNYCYDFGDEWAKYQDLVGYRHDLRINKKYDKPDESYLLLFSETKKFLLDNNFIPRLIDYIKKQAELDFAYFSVENMFAYSYTIPGKKGLIKIATKKNIEYILDNLIVTIERY